MRLIRSAISIVLLAISPVATPKADATLIAYDDFNYSPGSNLSGQNGGTGFQGPWYFASGNNSYDIGSGSLSSPPLDTNGNRMTAGATSGNAWIRRDLPPSRTNPIGQNGSTLYVSALFKPTAVGNNSGYSVMSLVPNGAFGQVGRELTFGKAGSLNYLMGELGGGGRVFSDVQPQQDETVLLVLKAEFNANGQANDTFSLFVNPDPRLPESTPNAVKTDFNVGLLGYLAIRSTGAFELDEIRMGTTFEDVTPFTSVPEPTSSAVLLTLSAFACGWRKRRRNRK